MSEELIILRNFTLEIARQRVRDVVEEFWMINPRSKAIKGKYLPFILKGDAQTKLNTAKLVSHVLHELSARRPVDQDNIDTASKLLKVALTHRGLNGFVPQYVADNLCDSKWMLQTMTVEASKLNTLS